jgi:hypothetical protein
MAHFAKLDANNVVIFVTVGCDEGYSWNEATTSWVEAE